MSAHRLVIARDEEDWYWITCSCGFGVWLPVTDGQQDQLESGPFPGHSHAVDEADDHEADVEAGA